MLTVAGGLDGSDASAADDIRNECARIHREPEALGIDWYAQRKLDMPGLEQKMCKRVCEPVAIDAYWLHCDDDPYVPQEAALACVTFGLRGDVAAG
jgi:hypothetical protein